MEAHNATTEAQSENTQTFEGSAEDLATIAKVSFNMGKKVTVVSEDGEAHLHEGMSAAQSQGKEAYVGEEEFDPSGELKRVCISAFYYTISGDDKVIVGDSE